MQERMSMRRKALKIVAMGITTISLAWNTPVQAANEAEVAEHLIELMNIGREVVSENQATINDAAKADKGFTADFVTGNCVSPQGRQANPQNLYPPFAAPLPTSQPSDLIIRCGAMGRGADFATGRCM